ncbi:hypothetical protein [Echinicola rosea]|uniref:Uncharacterized protein n=1 Tax=Echinicola rosea TaxID=1807691 RepID=A0ABQ1VCH9_9BACT|nr:hypothetical protein [Echinicola rosea]GGF51697.1 hypothetical protein GCM10011339_45290 [Echinicola rosea]
MATKQKTEKVVVMSKISRDRYQELLVLLSKSTNHSMSALIRQILSNRPVKCRTYDQTYDRVLEGMHSIQMEIQEIAVNVDQMVHDVLVNSGTPKDRKMARRLEGKLKEALWKLEVLEKMVQGHFGT